MPPTDYRIARIRQRAETHFLTDRCTLQYLVPGTGIVQGPGVWQTAASNVPCRLIQLAKQGDTAAAILAGQEVIPEHYTLELPYNQTIEPDYRVTVNGVVYEVTRIEAALTHRGFKQVVITRRRGAGT